MTDRPLVLGAVAYDPKVVTIWEGFKAYLGERGLPVDYVLFSNYETQVESHMRGGIDLAWNSPLAWVRTRRLATNQGVEVWPLVMRDADRSLTSAFLVRADDPATSLQDLAGRRVGVGAVDSPQATLIPLQHLRETGVSLEDMDLIHHDVFAGKHGDHGTAERMEAAALAAGDVEAACVLSANVTVFESEGIVAPGALRVLGETAEFDHCNFTVGPGAEADPMARFGELLTAMNYDDPDVRPLCDLEGLKRWEPGRTSGYDMLERAVDASGFYDEHGAITASNYRY
ncbi:MAG: phosphate/phosphite/phosphonate ABC transporter substrate-binding protein [Actinomycetota bacterium]